LFFSVADLSTKRAKKGDKLNVRCIAEHQTLLDAAFPQAFFHLRGDVDEGPAGGHFEKQLFAVAFHGYPPDDGKMYRLSVVF
jgi:hypothetical protein